MNKVTFVGATNLGSNGVQAHAKPVTESTKRMAQEMLPQLWMLTSASGMPGPKVLLSESSLADGAKMVPVVSQVRFSSTRAEAL